MNDSKWPRRKHFGKSERDAVLAVFRREMREGGAVVYDGIENRTYCQAFSQFLGGGYSIAVNSGTNAVYIALRSLELEPGDEVIVPAVSDPGGVMPVALLNCIPIPADTEPGSLNTSIERIQEVATDRTRAIIVAHIGGHPVKMEPIVEFARHRNIALVEDCAQAHGATYRGRMVGTLGDIAAFSTMYGKQHCTGGQGGVVFTRNSILYTRARQLADRGKSFGAVGDCSNMVASLNFNQDEISLAIGRVQLAKLPKSIERRRAFAAEVERGLSKVKCVEMIGDEAECAGSYWFLLLRLDRQSLRCDVESFVEALTSDGIGGVAAGYPYYPCDQVWFREAVVFGTSGHPWKLFDRPLGERYRLPNARAANRNLVRIQVHESLRAVHARRLCRAISKAASYFRTP